jgi:hypothetical protein
MQNRTFSRAGRSALLLTLAFVASWETYWRSQGFKNSYNDDESLWAYHRQRVYDASPAAPVLIGSSRIKFDIDLATWEAVTGGVPIQLAHAGTSPRPVLKDLADDEHFTGPLIVDVTELLFFMPMGGPYDKQASNSVKFYPNWSLAQQASFHVNQALESQLLFLDEERFALRFLLERLRIPNRPGVFAVPPFPMKFTTNDQHRQTFITDDFVADTAMQHEQQQIWYKLLTTAPKMPVTDSTLTQIFEEVKSQVAKIQRRGGKVVFLRMPSTGPFRELEKQAMPREKYWDRLLRETGAPGIHFEDYPQLAGYPCIEWSHLTPANARAFTRDLVPILEQKTGWALHHPRAAAHTTAISSSTLTFR